MTVEAMFKTTSTWRATEFEYGLASLQLFLDLFAGEASYMDLRSYKCFSVNQEQLSKE